MSSINDTDCSGRVFVIGWDRTGTTSAVAAISRLGFNILSWHRWYLEDNAITTGMLDDLLHGRCYSCLDRFDGADQCVAPVFRSVDAFYPDAKFILTVRDSESWETSWVEHRKWLDPKWQPAFDFRTLWRIRMSGAYYTTADSMPEIRRRYLEYNDSVLRHFSGRDNLLVMNLFDGDGWPELCRFLEVPDMTGLFPHANRRCH